MVYLSKIPGIQCKQKEKNLWGVLHIWGCTLCRFKFILWTQSSVSLYALPLSLALKWGLISLSYLPQTSKCFQRSSCFHFSQWHHNNNFFSCSVQSLSHVQLFVTPWTAACQASLSITNSQSPPKPMSIELVMPSNHLIFCRPLLLLPSIFPSIRVFSNESALGIRWPKYCSFSFNISPLSKLRLSLLCLKNKQKKKKKNCVGVVCVCAHR